MFDHIVGNEPIKAYFSKAIRTSTLPSAILLSGFGKNLFAQALASALLQTNKLDNHPDFHSFRPESKSGLHAIDSLRHLIEEVYSASYQGAGKVFIIYDAERMQTASANALLKTLEEPNPDTTLILVTDDPSAILPTIRSRCSPFVFKPVAEEQSASFLLAPKPQFEEALFSLLGQRPMYPKLLKTIEQIEAMIDDEDPVKKNQNVEHILTAILIWHRDQHARKIGCKDLFFPEIPSVDFALPSMDKVIVVVDQARLSFQRNIKFATILEEICRCS